MNNKYSVACITLVHDKYKIKVVNIGLHGTPARRTLQFVRRCYGLRGRPIYGRFENSKSNRTADSIRTQKKDSQVPSECLRGKISALNE